MGSSEEVLIDAVIRLSEAAASGALHRWSSLDQPSHSARRRAVEAVNWVELQANRPWNLANRRVRFATGRA
jgi:hypothetical protein